MRVSRRLRCAQRLAIAFSALTALTAFTALQSLPAVQAEHDDPLDDFTCQDCAGSAEYCPSNGTFYACPTDSVTVSPAAALHDCTCNNGFSKTCDSGGTTGTTDCNSGDFTCPQGQPPSYYQGGDAFLCATERETIEAGATVITECLCTLGHEPRGATSSEACVACNNGFYKDGTDNNPCAACPPFSGHDGTASVTIADCMCNAGYSGLIRDDTHVATCEQCDAGTYKDVRGEGDGTDGACFTCTDNHYCIEGTVDPSACRTNSVRVVAEHGAGVDAESCLCSAGFTLDVEQSEPDIYTEPCVQCARGKARSSVSNDDCVNCSATPPTFADSLGTIDCTVCNANMQQSENRQACQCLKGFYDPFNHITSNPTCTACETSKYQTTAASSSCIDCPVNSEHSLEAQSLRSVCKCSKGYYTGTDITQDATYCQSCLSGTYKDTINNTATCTDCPANSETAANLLESFVEGSLDSQSTCICKAGFYNTGTAADELDCQPCAKGTFKAEQGNEACTNCGLNKAYNYQDQTGQTGCIDCPGNSSSLEQSTALTDCLCFTGFGGPLGGPCEQCQPGTYNYNGVCNSCGENEYQPTAGAFAQCLSCTPDVSQSNADFTKCLCNAGYTCRDVECFGDNITPECSEGSNCPEVQTSPSGHTSSRIKSYAIDGLSSTQWQSTSINYMAGEATWLLVDLGAVYALGKIRLQSYTGIHEVAGGQDRVHSSYQIRLGTSADFTSPDNYDVDCGDVSCFPVGFDVDAWLFGQTARYVFIWKPGKDTNRADNYQYMYVGELTIYAACPRECPDGACVACPANTYKDTIDDAECTTCQTNSQSVEASTLQEACKCNLGYIQADMELICTACLPGQYSDAYQFDSNDDGTNDLHAISCTDCGGYHYTSPHPAGSSADCKLCTDSDPTTNCEDGSYWSSGCLLVAPATADDEINNREFECSLCTADLTGTDTASVDNDYNRGPDACVCVRGAYETTLAGDESACVACPDGNYKDTFGNEACTACTDTDPNTDTLSCSQDVENCDEPTDCLCKVGYYYDAGNQDCTICSAGSFKASISNDAACTTCDANSGSWGEAIDGQTEIDGLSVCTCDAGYDRQNGVCTACPAGKFKAFGGDYACEDCAVGYYAPAPAADAPGATACTPCQANSESNPGASQCACQAGFEQVASDASDAGGLSHEAAGFFCQACVAELTFKTNVGTEACTDCSTACGLQSVSVGSIDVSWPFYVTALCTPTTDIVCTECDFCTKGSYVTRACVETSVQLNANTVCAQCESPFYCPDDCVGDATGFCERIYETGTKVQCDNGAASQLPYESADDCGCAPGDFVDPDQEICLTCTGDFWCLNGQQFNCPANSSIQTTHNTAADHDDIYDCMCNPGYYRDPYERPASSTPSDDDLTSGVAFTCHDCFHDSDQTMYDQITNHQATYCKDNVQNACADANEETGPNDDHQDDCKCKAGYYLHEASSPPECVICPQDSYCPALDDAQYLCADVVIAENSNRHTLSNQQDNPESCVCKPGFYSNNAMNGIDGLDVCVQCTAGYFCTGTDNLKHLCTANSESLPESKHAGDCECKAGFGCTTFVAGSMLDGTGCPGNQSSLRTSHNKGTCTACDPGPSNAHTGGQYKNEKGNTACLYCKECAHPLKYASQECFQDTDRICGDCPTCAGEFFLSVPCSQTDALERPVCSPCNTCTGLSYPFIKTDCKEDGVTGQDRVCKDIDVGPCQTIGEYRSLLDEKTGIFYNSDSTCEPCELPKSTDYPTDGNKLHTFTSAGREFNNAESCKFTCLPGTVLRAPSTTDGAEILQGCKTCETGNFLLKDIQPGVTDNVIDFNGESIIMPVTCQFVCDSEAGSRLSDDGTDCVLWHNDRTFTGYVALTSGAVQRYTPPEAPDPAVSVLHAWQFTLQHTTIGRFVLVAGKDLPTCGPINLECCVNGQLLVVDYADRAVGAVDRAGVVLPPTVSCADPARGDTGNYIVSSTDAGTEFVLSDAQLPNYANCDSQDGVLVCSMFFTFIDILLHKQASISVHLQKHSMGHMVLTNNKDQHYILLDFFNVHTRLLYTDTDNSVYEVELHLRSEFPSPVQAEISVHSSADTMSYSDAATFVDVDEAEVPCTRHSLHSASSGIYSESETISTGVQQHWRTRWSMPSDRTSMRVRIDFRRTGSSSLWISSIDMLRKVDEYHAICDSVNRAELFTLGTAQIALGLSTAMQVLDSSTAGVDLTSVNTHGATNKLCTIMLERLEDVPLTISRVTIFAVHLQDLDASQKTEYSDLDATEHRMAVTFRGQTPKCSVYGFSQAMRAFCDSVNTDPAAPKCYLESIHAHDPQMVVLPTCNTTEQNAATLWLRNNIGNVPDRHSADICSVNSQDTKHAVVLMLKLRANAGAAWDSTNPDNAQKQITTNLWIGSATTSQHA